MPPTVVRLVPLLDFGGVESRLKLQGRLSRERGYEMVACTFDRAGAAAQELRASGTRVDELGVPARIRSPRASLALFRYLRRVRPQVLHSSIVEANFHTLLVARAAGVPAIIVEEVGTPTHTWAARLAFRALYRRADRIVCVSKAISRYVIQTDRAPAERVRVVYNCAHPRFFPEERVPPRSRPRGEPFRLLAVGRLHPVKNHLTLLEAMARVRHRHADVRLDLVGEGPLSSTLRDRVASLGLGGTVRLLGYRDDIPALLARADGYVLPSMSEGCSISLIEAMATGTPCVGSAVDGIREVLGDDVADRWTFSWNDPAGAARTLEALVELDDEARRGLGLTVQQRAYDVFSPSAYMDRLDALYAEVTDLRRIRASRRASFLASPRRS